MLGPMINGQPTTSPLAIEATGLVKSFGDTRAVDGVDLAVRSGSVYGVLGPNGAGKTTTIRMLATLLRPDAGEARVLGHDVVPEHPGAAGVGAQQRREHADRGGLAGAVGAEHAVDRAGAHGQIDTVDGARPAEGLDETGGLDGKRGVGRHLGPRSVLVVRGSVAYGFDVQTSESSETHR